ncbi:MAG: 50S ribosomal protein L17 [Candidatus Omnitrophica bacterium]|nr:50S ribosomal protein L17 [Candidatus Omnitrophota bacterium]MBU1048132.1 50S ribosomal protein L17 [Candidatus Omnitrophota bacterium]MBU1630727.1 50S ribosomal protein L17 [Candidatus Omnitrophota bacterium]MBU1889227.1 50S ribosomal protein L17 [Candidatus Omnitrophota bacterium]
MRHINKKRKLGMKASRRKSVLKNLFTSLLAYGKVKTTEIRGKELVRVGNSLIEKAKKSDLASRRKVSSHITKDTVSINFFQEILPKLANRTGGYLRLLRVGIRKGDGAKVVMVQLITEDGSKNTPASQIAGSEDRKQKAESKIQNA